MSIVNALAAPWINTMAKAYSFFPVFLNSSWVIQLYFKWKQEQKWNTHSCIQRSISLHHRTT